MEPYQNPLSLKAMLAAESVLLKQSTGGVFSFMKINSYYVTEEVTAENQTVHKKITLSCKWPRKSLAQTA